MRLFLKSTYFSTLSTSFLTIVLFHLGCESPYRKSLESTSSLPQNNDDSFMSSINLDLGQDQHQSPMEHDLNLDLIEDQRVNEPGDQDITLDETWPWFEEHIHPIMVRYCVACHGEQPAGGGPSGFRLDVCEDEMVSGAKLMASRIVARAIEGQPSFMPPGSILSLSASESSLIKRWVEIGTPCQQEEINQMMPTPTLYHPSGWADPSAHGIATKQQQEDCRECHGSDLQGESALGCDSCHASDWRTNCTFCHGGMEDETGAPPRGLHPDRPDIFPAHQAHVEGTLHAPYECTQCHLKPTDVLSVNHIFDSTPARSEVNFQNGLSVDGTYTQEGCDNLYCHGTGQSLGGWSIEQGAVTCTSCHANQTSGRSGWRNMSGQHEDHLREGITCDECHGSVVGSEERLVNINLHVNGHLDLSFSSNITRNNGRC